MWNIHVRIKYSETPEQRPILAGASKCFSKINVEPDFIRVVKLFFKVNISYAKEASMIK